MGKKKITSLKSMTGFGVGREQSRLGRFEVEIQSVNRRHLEIVFSLPRELSSLEYDLRTWLQSRIGRGQVSLSLSWRSPSSASSVKPNIERAKALKAAYAEIAKVLRIEPLITLEMLAKDDKILASVEGKEKVTLKSFEKALENAFEEFERMRKKEGEALALDFQKRLLTLKKAIEKIKGLSAHATKEYREKLLKRMEEALNKSVTHDERILKEIALFAEKIDVEEEITRFLSHLDQMQTLVSGALQKEGETKGKRIEFLLQELLRECNTIGSKTNQVEISGLVVDIKCELERLREQVQNIE